MQLNAAPGGGAHTQRVRLLSALHDAGHLVYVGMSSYRPPLYIVDLPTSPIGKYRLELATRQVVPYVAGVAQAHYAATGEQIPGVMEALKLEPSSSEIKAAADDGLSESGEK